MSTSKGKTYVIRGYSPHKDNWYYPTSATTHRSRAKPTMAFPNWTADINTAYKYTNPDHAWEDVWMMQQLAEQAGKINHENKDKKLNGMMFLHSLVVVENKLESKTYWWMKPND